MALGLLKINMENIRKCTFSQLMQNDDPFEISEKNLNNFFDQEEYNNESFSTLNSDLIEFLFDLKNQPTFYSSLIL